MGERCPNPNCDGLGHIGMCGLGCSVCEGKDHPPMLPGEGVPPCCVGATAFRRADTGKTVPLQREVWVALLQGQPTTALEAVIRPAVEERRITPEAAKSLLERELERSRAMSDDDLDPRWDAVADVMDLLVGYCGPQAVIRPREEHQP